MILDMQLLDSAKTEKKKKKMPNLQQKKGQRKLAYWYCSSFRPNTKVRH